jgi:PEP-CTERM motif
MTNTCTAEAERSSLPWRDLVLKKVFCSAFILVCISTAHATPLSFGVPIIFQFGAVGSPASKEPFTFTGPGIVTIVDAGLDTDQFTVSDGATVLGNTSTPANNGDGCGAYDSCIADPNFSIGVFALGAGSHSIDITTLLSPLGSGLAFINLDPAAASPVPEPSSFALLGTGVLGFAGVVRRKIGR